MAVPVLLHASQPNIVFIYNYDQRCGDVGAYLHPDIQTPNLDAFAAEGMLITQVYAASPDAMVEQ